MENGFVCTKGQVLARINFNLFQKGFRRKERTIPITGTTGVSGYFKYNKQTLYSRLGWYAWQKQYRFYIFSLLQIWLTLRLDIAALSVRRYSRGQRLLDWTVFWNDGCGASKYLTSNGTKFEARHGKIHMGCLGNYLTPFPTFQCINWHFVYIGGLHYLLAVSSLYKLIRAIILALQTCQSWNTASARSVHQLEPEMYGSSTI